MPKTNRSFRLLTAGVIACLGLFLYWTWSSMFRAERERVAEVVEQSVLKAADSLQRANLTGSNIIGSFADSERNEKLAFAIGMTGNLGKMTLDFDRGEAAPASSGSTAPVISRESLRAANVKFIPGSVLGIGHFDTLFHRDLLRQGLKIPYRIVAITPGNRFQWADSTSRNSRSFVINYFDPAVYAISYEIPGTQVLLRLWPYGVASALIVALVSAALALFHKALRSRQQAEQFRSSLFSNATHELKTPLTSLQLIVESALSEVRDGQARLPAGHLRFADSEIRRMKLLVARILAFGRLDGTQFALDKSIVQLDAIVQDALGALELLIRERGATVHYEHDPALGLKGEAILLTNLVVSMLENALKHTAGQPGIRVGARRESDQVVISISDNGPGISPRYHRRIFEPFFRTPAAIAKGIAGHGLGLSFALQVAQLHGGDIRVSTESKAGTTFIIRLGGACSISS